MFTIVGVGICSPGACGYVKPNPPNVNTKQTEGQHVKSATTNAESKWSSLFSTLPKNAGEYLPRLFDTIEIDGAMVPADVVLATGVEYWNEERLHVFEADPSIIEGKPFIITL